MRVNTVQGYVSAGILPSTVLQRFRQRLDAILRNLPPGYRYQFGGETDERDTAVHNLLGAVGIIVVLMGTTRVLSFNSFMAGIVSVVVGLLIGHGLASLWVFGYPFGFMAIVGIMGLVGLAVNDAIVVLAALRELVPAAYLLCIRRRTVSPRQNPSAMGE